MFKKVDIRYGNLYISCNSHLLSKIPLENKPINTDSGKTTEHIQAFLSLCPVTFPVWCQPTAVSGHPTTMSRRNEASTNLGDDHCHCQVFGMSSHVTEHHDAGQPYVPFAGLKAVDHCSHTSCINEQLWKLKEKKKAPGSTRWSFNRIWPHLM